MVLCLYMEISFVQFIPISIDLLLHLDLYLSATDLEPEQISLNVKGQIYLEKRKFVCLKPASVFKFIKNKHLNFPHSIKKVATPSSAQIAD